MKKLLLILMSFFFVLAVNVGHADAVPDIRGEYSGSYTIVVSNCTDSSSNGTYYAVLAMSIPTQTGNTFSGSATGTFDIDDLIAVEYIQLSGTITETGQISGNTSHTFLGTGGEGTFTGQLSGDTLSIENPGHDTYGDTCTYTRYMSATREGGLTPSANFSANPTSGNAPLSVNFTDESTGNIISWNWNFGDGASSSIQNPSHTYTDPGIYTVSLTVSGPYGSDTETKTDYISIAGISNSTEFKILPSDGARVDSFGNSVSISGGYAIVGTAYTDDNESAYVFEKSGSSWNQVAKLTASDGAYNDHFGYSVSISGGYAIVGAYRDDFNGSAYVFEKSGSSWNQVAKLTASDGAYNDHFGYSVSISGGYAIVGAYRDDFNGSAYVFEKSGSSWNQVAKLTASDGAANDSFGYSVSISGGYAIVGAYGDDFNGSAYVFEKSGSSWNQVAKLTASDGAANDFFGYSVSISGGYAIVGADDGNDGNGAAYVFEKSGSSWNQVAKLTASDGAYNDHFGNSVSISGGYAIVGALYDDDNGAAYVFEKSGSSWNQVAKLTASDGAYNDHFGDSVSISGGYAIVGAPNDDDNGDFSGSAYIFDLPIPGGVETGCLITSDLWIRAVINTEEKGPIEAVWKKGGEDTTSRGDRVIWGHFYASPSDVTWGSENNPDLFVKIWFDVSGRVDVNYFHVSVPEIEVYSDYPYDGTPDEHGITTMDRRYIRQYYENGQSYSDENYEDGNPPAGYFPAGNPSGYSTINDLRIGSIINTVEKGPIDAVWRLGGQDTTSRGDQVVWGHFYASPSDVTWGSENNPDLFAKIWFDVSGRVDVNFFHVSVPDIEVYSDLPDDGTYDQKGTTIMDNRYIRHESWR